MLTIVLGRAGTGKTAYAMGEIRRRMDAGEQDLLLIVPEQYSHDAERQLCKACGDALSLHGETLSFSRLCGRVFAQTGGAPACSIDSGGQLLVLYRALESVTPGLKAFGADGFRVETLERLLGMIKELKSLNISPEALEKLAERVPGPLAGKLREIALILGAYDACLHTYGDDAADKMTRLADRISDSAIGDEGHIFIDGFNDFTAQELRVIEELLRKGAGVTVCLTCPPDGGENDGDIFELPRRTFGKLKRLAAAHGAEVETIMPEMAQGGKAEELLFLEKHLFGHSPAVFSGDCGAVKVYSAQSRYAECEYAALKVWQLVREGFRWRDIGVMARDWGTYGRLCENVFEKYGVPFFSSGRNDLLTTPPAALIDAALDIAVSGWEYRPVFRYLKTGLLGIPAEACAELENYVTKWNIRGPAWVREWTLPPRGYGGDRRAEPDCTDALSRVNDLRRRITEPLVKLREGIKGVTRAGEKLQALNEFFKDIKLPELLDAKSQRLEEQGEMRLALEYSQIWDIIRGSMEQMARILGDSMTGASDFRKLLAVTLSQYDVGVIPVALDRTALGSVLMSRRRDLKCLIILGATDENFPALSKGGGVLSDSERAELAKIDDTIPAGSEERLFREMNAIYSTVTLPSKLLHVSYPGGAGERPSFIVKRLKAMFGIAEITLNEDEYMTAAKTPCFELAGMAESREPGSMAVAAREYFIEAAGDEAAMLTAAEAALRAGRGSLSDLAATKLYGTSPALSATRVDKYFACPFAHFLKNGLRLDRGIPAGFDAPEAGTFIHFVLEGVTREIKATTGFAMADEGLCRDLTLRYIEKYAHEALFDFEGANARFVYLFRRLEGDVTRIVLDMMDEMTSSDFEPLDFELELKDLSCTEGSGRDDIRLTGLIDRVDGFLHDKKNYLRVVDYKTGKKAFSLSDVTYGRDMQMLIYLFHLQKYGGERYGGGIAPAGVLYVPARDVILKAPRNVTEEELEMMRGRARKRSGIILNDPAVVEAMEKGDVKKYLPVKIAKGGDAAGDSLVSQEQIELLSKHVEGMLRRAGEEIMNGGIQCSPYYKNDGDNACVYCEYGDVCGFDETSGDRRRFLRKLSAGEIWEKLRNEN